MAELNFKASQALVGLQAVVNMCTSWGFCEYTPGIGHTKCWRVRIGKEFYNNWVGSQDLSLERKTKTPYIHKFNQVRWGLRYFKAFQHYFLRWEIRDALNKDFHDHYPLHFKLDYSNYTESIRNANSQFINKISSALRLGSQRKASPRCLQTDSGAGHCLHAKRWYFNNYS